MEDCTESHQSAINRKIKANDKRRNMLTSMLEEHRVLIYGDSCLSNMQSMDDEKAAPLAAKTAPTLAMSDPKNRKSGANLRKYREETSRHVWTSCRNGSKQIGNWNRSMPNMFKTSRTWRLWWQSKQWKMPRLSTKSSQEPNRRRQAPYQTKRHKPTILSVFISIFAMQSQGCNSVSEQFAGGATEEDVNEVSQIMNWRQSPPEPGTQARMLPCEELYIESQEAIKGSLSNAHTEKRRLAKRGKQGGGGKQPVPSMFLDFFLPRGYSISRFPESWGSGRPWPFFLTLQQSCMAPSSMNLASGPRI